MRKIIPESVASSIEEGITAFEKKIKGYSRDDTLLLGIESRTSSPVKILRDESMHQISEEYIRVVKVPAMRGEL